MNKEKERFATDQLDNVHRSPGNNILFVESSLSNPHIFVKYAIGW